MSVSLDAILIKLGDPRQSLFPRDSEKVLAERISLLFRQNRENIWKCDVRELELLKERFHVLKIGDSEINGTILRQLEILRMAVWNIEGVLNCTAKKKITEESRIYAIAKACLESNPCKFLINIDKFSLGNRNLTDRLIALYLNKYQLDIAAYETRGDRIGELLLSSVNNIEDFDIGALTENIKNMGIDSEELRTKIAIACGVKDAYNTVYYIKNFKLYRQRNLFTAAMVCAARDGLATSLYMERFGLRDQKHLLKVALACVEQNEGSLKHISHFFISNRESLRFEIAVACAGIRAGGVSRHIEEFNLVSDDYRFKAAMTCVINDAGETIPHIEKFELSDQNRLYKLALACAAREPEITACCIRCFGLTEQTLLFKVARACAKRNGAATAKYIRNFDLEDPAQLTEIAFACAKQDSESTAAHITNFGSLNREDIITIAMMNVNVSVSDDPLPMLLACAEKSGSLARFTIAVIRRFDIADKAILFKIALACARQNGKMTARYINNFGITDRAQLFEIALACAKQNGGMTARYIANFGITDRDRLFEIALTCAKQNGMEIRFYLKAFNITGQKEKELILLEAILQNPKALFFCNEIAGVRPSAIELSMSLSGPTQELKKRLKNFAADHFPDPYFVNLVNKLTERDSLKHLGAALFLLFYGCDGRQIERIKNMQFMEAIFDFRSPRMKWNLLTAVIRSVHESPWTEISFETSPAKRLLDITCLHIKNRLQNPAGLRQLIASFKECKDIWKNGHKLSVLIESLYNLGQETSLNESYCTAILQKINEKIPMPRQESNRQSRQNFRRDFKIAVNEAFKDLQNINAIIIMGEGRNLTNMNESFENILNSSVYAFIGAKEEKNLSDAFLKKFYCSRRPTAITIYAGKIRSLGDYELNNALRRFIIGVSRDSFYKDRYDLTQNAHLRMIARKAPGTLERWKALLNPVYLQSVTDRKRQSFVAAETEDYMDLLLCGTEVSNSCLSVNKHPIYSRCLLGYLLDGKIHLLVIKDQEGPQGKIRARCLLRLMFDGTKPILMIDRYYGSLPADPYENLLYELAKSKAKLMGLSLIGTDIKGEPYPKMIRSLGCSVPFEYVDSRNQMFRGGAYTLDNTVLIA